jgi:hypothetical protein
MKNIQASVARFVAGAGAPGLIAAGLLVFVAAFYFSSLRPEQARLADLHRQVEAMQRGAAQGAEQPKRSVSETLGEFYGSFPPSARLPDLLEKIFAAAERQQLRLDQGEYRVSRDNAGALMQFQMLFPVKGAYPQIRKFVADALADVPTLSLDSIQFERQKVGDAAVEAKVKLVVYLGRPS